MEVGTRCGFVCNRERKVLCVVKSHVKMLESGSKLRCTFSKDQTMARKMSEFFLALLNPNAEFRHYCSISILLLLPYLLV